MKSKVPHFWPWPSHGCSQSPLFSERDGPVPCPLPTPTPSLARAPGSQLQKNLRPAPVPQTSPLPACWDTSRVSVHARVLQGPLAKVRFNSRGSRIRLQTHLALWMCPLSPQLGPVPRAASQPGEAVRSLGAGASGLSGLVSSASPPPRGTTPGRPLLAPWPLTSLPLSNQLHPTYLLWSPGGAWWLWKGCTPAMSLAAVGGSNSPSVSSMRQEQGSWVPRVPPRALLVRNCSPGEGQPHPTGAGQGGRHACSLRRTVRNGPPRAQQWDPLRAYPCGLGPRAISAQSS